MNKYNIGDFVLFQKKNVVSFGKILTIATTGNSMLLYDITYNEYSVTSDVTIRENDIIQRVENE